RRQISYLFERSEFYRAKLGAAGLTAPGDVGGLDDIAALPFTTKDEIRRTQADQPPFGAHLAAPAEDVRRAYSTSGTTAEPCYIAVPGPDLRTWVQIRARSYTAAGIRPGQGVVLTYNAGPFVAGAVLDSFSMIGASIVPVGSGNTERLVRACRRLGAEAIAC